jgi:hypothetical protein
VRRLSLVAAALAGAIPLFYIGLLIKQGGPVAYPTVPIVAGVMVAMAGLTIYGHFGPDAGRRALALWAAVPGFFGLGFLALFSIGLILWVVGLVVLAAAIAALRGIEVSARAAIGWAVVIVLAWAAILGALFIPLIDYRDAQA